MKELQNATTLVYTGGVVCEYYDSSGEQMGTFQRDQETRKPLREIL